MPVEDVCGVSVEQPVRHIHCVQNHLFTWVEVHALETASLFWQAKCIQIIDALALSSFRAERKSTKIVAARKKEVCSD